jgi:four helix bundle protein
MRSLTRRNEAVGSEQIAPINSCRDLVVWQEAMNIAEATYRLTGTYPKEESYGLTAHLRRSASSVAANIAEGYGRDSKGAYVQHLRVAQGSLKEFETHLLLSERVNLVENEKVASLLTRSDLVGKMLRSLIRSIEGSDDRS